MQELTSLQNPSFKVWRKLTSPRGRKKEGAYLVESAKLLAEALGSGAPVEAILICQGKDQGLVQEMEGLLSRFQDLVLPDFKTYLLAPSLFQKLSFLSHSDGVMGVVQGSLGKEVKELGQLKQGRTLLLDRIQDPGNIGTLVRSAEAFGMDRVLALDSAEFENPKALRAAMGSSFRLDLYQMRGEDFLLASDQEDFQIAGADMEGESYLDLAWPEDFFLAIGNEGQGLAQEIQDRLAIRVKIPMVGQVESLNAGVSAAILMADIQAKKDRLQ